MREILRCGRRMVVSSIICLSLPVIGGRSAQAQTYTLSTLATFNGSNGANPYYAPLAIDNDGNLYGTTAFGGSTDNFGTVFKISTGNNNLKTLATFDNANGGNPFGGVTIDSTGNLIGTTEYGGAAGVGTVFQILKGSSEATTIASVNGQGTGQSPRGPVIIDSNGDIFGATAFGGANGDGTLFEIKAGTNTVTTLIAFNESGNGEYPLGGVLRDSSGNLYGTTEFSGPGGAGTVFKFSPATSTLVNLATFSGGNGANPSGNLIMDAQGNLFGTTAYGSSSIYDHGNHGTVFEIAAGTNTLKNLVSFTGLDGGHPDSGLVMDSNGNLFGTTELGGDNNDGTVFEYKVDTQSLITLATFDGAGNGAAPYAGLAIDNQGNLYGTTESGGQNGQGTVFKLSPSNQSSEDEPPGLGLLLWIGLPLLPRLWNRHIRFDKLRNAQMPSGHYT